MFGKLTINTGSMYSGKSSELLRQGERHLLAGHKVVFIKPAIDLRYTKDEIVTHTGAMVEAIRVRDIDRIDTMAQVVGADVVLIDEVQFFDDWLIMQIIELLKKGKQIYCSGLDMDFMGEPFSLTADLLARADVVNKFKAVCAGCGADATYSGKNAKASKRKRIEVGAKELYIPLCRDCFNKQRETGKVC